MQVSDHVTELTCGSRGAIMFCCLVLVLVEEYVAIKAPTSSSDSSVLRPSHLMETHGWVTR